MKNDIRTERTVNSRFLFANRQVADAQSLYAQYHNDDRPLCRRIRRGGN